MNETNQAPEAFKNADTFEVLVKRGATLQTVGFTMNVATTYTWGSKCIFRNTRTGVSYDRAGNVVSKPCPECQKPLRGWRVLRHGIHHACEAKRVLAAMRAK